VLPNLQPREFTSAASFLGVHAEGPYLDRSKPGAHDPELFLNTFSVHESPYGQYANDNSIIKLVTVAPELPYSDKMIENFVSKNIRVSLGHSSATFDQGLAALKAGASCLTHTMNCMAPVHQRSPGLVGLVSLPTASSPLPPYYTILCDGVHLHSSIASLLFRAHPKRAIIVSDSVELAGLPDGLYAGNGQIHHKQRKSGKRVTIDETDVLVGSSSTVAEGVKNIIKWSGCDVAEAVRTVTENVVDLMGVKDRGMLEQGRRADFVVLDDAGDVKETWIAGVQVWGK
jgi:N-acetylglucosamine-6-phosphate deacetylase